MARRLTGNVKKLARLFSSKRIPIEGIGFYNHPSFLQAERTDPSFLDQYAAWVRARPRDKKYDDHVRKTLPRIVDIVVHELRDDTAMGACRDASMLLTKLFELEGIWCYAAKGAVSIDAPSLGTSTNFWLFDTVENAAHVWVVAPPFEIIDITLRQQHYSHGERELLPEFVLLESAETFTPVLSDFCSLELRGQLQQYEPPQSIVDAYTKTMECADFFPSYRVKFGTALVSYAVGGITVSEAPSIYEITNRRWNGRLAGELYDNIVRPKLSGVGR